ncbi:UV-B-induced protein At3g17800, chloroplastic [Linum perenne]
MESALSNHSALSSLCLPHRSFSGKGIRGIASFVPHRRFSSPAATIIVARAGSSSSSHCEPSSSSSGSLNIPIEPRSSTGKFIKDVFQNQRPLFHVAVREELKLLAGERDAALDRLSRTSDSDQAVLHRRIAELKEYECQVAAEDVMYMLILHKFSEIRVPLVPKLTKCIHNGRLEPLPPKDYELESIHTPDVLEMIKEHVSTMIELRSDSSIADSCTTTEIHKSQLGQMYSSSILYGYFLKSASVRHDLDQCLGKPEHDQHHLTRRPRLGRCNLVLDRVNESQMSRPSAGQSLRSYVMGFNAETLQRCARLRSEEAMSLIERQSWGVFGDCGDDDESVVTSFSSLRRLVLEAVAFGRFLWDSEEYVDSVFKLRG